MKKDSLASGAMSGNEWLADVRNLLVVAALSLMANFAGAAPIIVRATGVVTDVFTPWFDTTVGEQITLRAQFDSSALLDVHSLGPFSMPPGVQFASLATDPAASLLITLGSTRSWNKDSEPLFGSTFHGFFPTPLPQIVLVNGRFLGVNFFGINPLVGDPAQQDTFVDDVVNELIFGDPPGTITGGDAVSSHPPFWDGLWNLANATVTVSAPGTNALTLLGLALLGAFTFRRIASIQTGSRG